eukprot:gnl/MRDRNA2_/MRDRNA2_81533_c0_seq3.p1 gnl/MRDRNA2_/MRDRNA2_81533_c0~~gnl/MRDRNA2_/MRDRNA2_81533_c0_seq3.p1  ORF type:complete len:239 (+),score=22.28 gnl/MRDRNA2_/MRDRNA2_81533_c0_seq3:84-719(+)
MAHPIDTPLTLNGQSLRWYKVNDVVMGGHSSSELSASDDGGLRFSGVISTRDGGFASCSTLEQALQLPATTTGFNVSITTNGELFKFTLKTSESVWEPVWQADLREMPGVSLQPGVQHNIVLPLSRFLASQMGRTVSGKQLDVTQVKSIGLNLALVDEKGNPNPSFHDGPFEMVLHSVAIVTEGQHGHNQLFHNSVQQKIIQRMEQVLVHV